MLQGDTYSLGIRILNNAFSPVTAEDVIDVEITLGHLCKSYRGGQLRFYEGVWMFPLSQKETFGFGDGRVRAQVRVKWANGVVEGKPLYGVRFLESISKEVL